METVELVETIDRFHLSFTSIKRLFYGIDSIDRIGLRRLAAGSNPAGPILLPVGEEINSYINKNPKANRR